MDLEGGWVAPAGFAPLRRQRPGGGIEIDLAPASLRRLPPARSREREQCEGPERGIALRLKRSPDRDELLLSEGARANAPATRDAQAVPGRVWNLDPPVEGIVIEAGQHGHELVGGAALDPIDDLEHV